MSTTATTTDRTRLTAADLVPDEMLRGGKKPIAEIVGFTTTTTHTSEDHLWG